MKLNWLKKKIFYIPAIVVVTGVLITSLYGGKKIMPSTFIVKKGTLVQEVTVSGTVKAKEAVELAFEKSGRVKKINVEVGDKVGRGTTLLSLENWSETTAVDDAQAKLDSKTARYNDLKKGSTPEEIKVKETGLAKAKSDLATRYSEISNIVGDAFNKADNAVHRQADILFSNALSSNPQVNFNSSDQQAVIDSQTGRFLAEGNLDDFKKLILEPETRNTALEDALIKAKGYLLVINDFLIKTNKALNASLSITDSTLATDKDALNTARTNVNTALTNINDQIQAIATQKITVEASQSELELVKAPASKEILDGALADVRSAEANFKNAEASLLKTYINSPIAGIVTRQDAKVGEIAGANTALVSVMSDNFKVEAFVPEVDVAKLSVGNPTQITLDAYGSDINFNAHVVKIDPAETVIDGVSTYKTTLEFDVKDTRIRSGMTANITIESARHENVVNVPQRSAYEKSGKKFVRVIDEKGVTFEREVSVGIRGSTGEIEILTGLNEGEKVLTSTK